MMNPQNPTVRMSSDSFSTQDYVILIWISGLKPQIYCFWKGESRAMDHHFDENFEKNPQKPDVSQIHSRSFLGTSGTSRTLKNINLDSQKASGKTLKASQMIKSKINKENEQI